MQSILVARMKEIRISARELARLSGVNQETIYDIRAGRTKPQPSTQAAIERALDAEERRLRDLTVARHGVPEGEGK